MASAARTSSTGPAAQQEQQQEQHAPAPATQQHFLAAQAAAIADSADAQLQAHAAACLGEWFAAERLLGRGQVFDAQLETRQGAVRAGGQHPLRRFLATPQLPPEVRELLAAPKLGHWKA